MSVRTAQELRTFNIQRENMTRKEKIAFVNDCFDICEKEGFAKVFCSPYEGDEARNGTLYKVLGRVKPYDEADIEYLPMWRIQFEDGHIMCACAEEIIPSEIKANVWYPSQKKLLEVI